MRGPSGSLRSVFGPGLRFETRFGGERALTSVKTGGGGRR
jgi:hypothetical protein